MALVQAVVIGLLIGGVYALMAAGLTLVFGVLRVVNVAQGALLILAAMLTWFLWRTTGLDPILSTLVTTPVMGGLGWLLYRGVVDRVRAADPAMPVLATFGIALVIEGVLNVTAGNTYRSATPPYFTRSFHVGGIAVPQPHLYGFAAAAAVLGALYLVLTRTWTGRAIRATAQNPSSAALVGVDARGTAALAFAIGVATTGAGGAVLSVLYPFYPASHYDWIAKLLGIIVLGVVCMVPGALTGAVILGLAETLTATYGSLRWSTLVFYLVILVVLLVRPQGLFGARLREDAA